MAAEAGAGMSETLPSEKRLDGSWHTDEPPDFTEHGFHTGRKVEYKLNTGQIIFDIYQGYGIFGVGRYHDWMAGSPCVIAWRPTP